MAIKPTPPLYVLALNTRNASTNPTVKSDRESKPFKLEEHPALKQDFFALPEGFADAFPYALQQRLADERRSRVSIGLRWLRVAAPVAAVVVLITTLYVGLAPVPENPNDQALAAATTDLSYESALEEIMLDPVLVEDYLPDLAPETAASHALKEQLDALPQESVAEFVDDYADQQDVLEYLESLP